MFKRALSVLFAIAMLALVGCAGPARIGGSATHIGPHHAVTIGGSGTNVIPAQYGGSPIFGSSTLSPSACPSGYRMVNGYWTCPGMFGGNTWAPTQYMQSGTATTCTVRSAEGDRLIEQTFNVGSPDDCTRLGRFVQQAKNQSARAVPTANVSSQPRQCSAGKAWTKLNWPGHPQHDTFVCLPDGDTHRF